MDSYVGTGWSTVLFDCVNLAGAGGGCGVGFGVCVDVDLVASEVQNLYAIGDETLSER